MKRAAASVVGLFRLTFRDPALVIDKVRGEPVYLILAMTADKLLRLKPQNLVTGLPVRAPGARDMSPAATPLMRIPVGVVVARHKAASQWIDYTWAPVAVLHGVPETQPWTVLRQEGDATMFYAGSAEIDALSLRDDLLSRQSGERLARPLGHHERDRRRSAVSAGDRDGRSIRRRRLHRERRQSGGAGADAAIDPGHRCGVRRRAPCRAAVLQAQARPAGYRVARAPRATETTMTEDDFLARWSRRKREVAKAEAEPQRRAAARPRKQPSTEAVQEAEPEFDIASLPPIESINALTDVTAFLRQGVPAELTRAALRRVWTADPAIRDFVGLAENAWDFTDPTAMPGFGPLESTDDVRRMIASIVDQIGHAAEVQSGERGEKLERFQRGKCRPRG